MTEPDNVVYTAKARTTGGREGASRSDDGRLDVQLAAPGTGTTGTNPEQLFAAGYSACFINAMQVVANKMDTGLPEDLSVDAEVDLHHLPGAYSIAVRITVHLPGMDRAEAQKVVDAAYKIWPYSNGTRENIGMALTLS